MIVCGKIARGWARCAQVLLTNHVQTNDFTNREAIELARAQEAKTRELQRCLKGSMSLLLLSDPRAAGVRAYMLKFYAFLSGLFGSSIRIVCVSRAFTSSVTFTRVVISL